MINRIVVVLSMITLLSTVGAAQEVRPVVSGDTAVVSQQDSAGLYKEDEEESSPLDRRVSIRVSNVPISVFLNSITTQAKVNFIMSEEFANKKVTASLTRVTVREALDTLLRVHGLAYQRIGKSDSYVVTKRSSDAPDTITKIYTLSYISLQELGGGSDMTSSLSSGSGSSSEGLGGSIGGGSSISSIISSMLSPVGKIAIDPRTNKLIITDVPEIFPQIENILAELDVRPPQILIEAQIVEVNKTSGLSLGFEYGGSGGTMLELTAPKRSIYADFFHRRNIIGEKFHGWNWIFPTQKEISNDSSETQTVSGDGDQIAYNYEKGDTDGGVLNWSAFNIVLRSLLTRGEAKYLGKPKVVTLNNKKATIQAQTDATVGQTMSQSGSGSGEGMTTVSAERKSVGLTLNVTPQVNREGYVTLLVEPSYSDIVSSGFDFSKDTTTRSASTLVRVKNGQTVVIGGLLSSRELDQTRKVPLLGDIPILGWLFTSKTKSKSTTDLVIFITPTILAE
ncbi:MAG: hypothetical protein J5601_06655 [Elusimicrobiaceae bacterium]|nr:hypothetical protein [Elusimicrobiaceae bacterium]